MSQFDCIVVGGGHNGLVTACYLARAGMHVCVVEKEKDVGGGVRTREMFGGYQMDLGGSAHIMIHQTPIIRELELERFGLEYIDLDPFAWHPTEDGRSVAYHRDLDRTCQSIAAVSERDADAYRRFIEFWTPINEGVIDAFLRPPTAGNLMRTMVSGKWGKRKNVPNTLRTIFSSYGQVVNEWFESEPVRASLLWLAAQSGPPPHEAASGDFVGWQSMLHVTGAKRPRGGSGVLTQAMARRLESDGGAVLCGRAARRVVVQGGRAVGVELEDGEVLGASRAVVCGTHVVTTLLDLIEPENLPEAMRRRAGSLRVGNGFGMILRCASRELPNYIAAPHDPAAISVGNPHISHIGLQLLCPSARYLNNAYADYLRGESARDPATLLMTFSAVDTTLAPPDRHTVFIWSQYHPYKLGNGEHWDQIREREAERIIAAAARYAPNLPDAITDVFIQTPLDIERTHGMLRGNVMHLEMSFDQMFFFRPMPELSDYTTPVDRLFLTGASTHPGGGIFGASGRNTAHVVLDKAGRKWWRGWR